MRLAHAELLMHLAMTTEGWRKALLDEYDGLLPVAEWPPDDPLVQLLRTYHLDPADVAKLCDQLGASLERRAENAGYAEHWDAPDDTRRPVHEPSHD